MTKVRMTLYDRPDERTYVLGPDDIVETQEIELGVDDQTGLVRLNEAIESLVMSSFGEFAELRLERIDGNG